MTRTISTRIKSLESKTQADFLCDDVKTALVNKLNDPATSEHKQALIRTILEAKKITFPAADITGLNQIYGEHNEH